MDLNEHNDVNNMQMNDSWHIPRASLGGSTSGSSNSSSKSNSNPPTVARHSAAHHFRQEGRANLTLVHNERTSHKALDKNRADQLYNNHRHSNKSRESSSAPVATKTVSAGRASAPVTGSGLKRGSRSSQGSTDSNNSSHSASSGSMLLTAANLERFVAIQNKQNSERYLGTIDPRTGKAYNSNIGISTNPGDQYPDQIADKMDTVIGIDPNLHFVKTKDVDAVSIASSTHFTMVNGMGGPQKKVKEGICSRGHQITVLILTMSMFFLIGILAMVYLLEMRAREMPQ